MRLLKAHESKDVKDVERKILTLLSTSQSSIKRDPGYDDFVEQVKNIIKKEIRKPHFLDRLRESAREEHIKQNPTAKLLESGRSPAKEDLEQYDRDANREIDREFPPSADPCDAKLLESSLMEAGLEPTEKMIKEAIKKCRADEIPKPKGSWLVRTLNRKLF